jgi:long-chain fatty acid transport protein
VMGQFQGTQFIIGGTYLGITMDLNSATGTRAPNFQPSQQPISGPGTLPNAVANPVIPGIYLSYAATSDLNLGLTVNVPFGLQTDYPDNFVGRYHALKTDLQIIDVNPNISYKVTPEFAVGAAFVARKTDAELTSAIDFGAIGAAKGIPNSVPGGADGFVSLKGSLWSYGFKAGFTYQPADNFHLGVGYQGAITLKVDGQVSYQNVPSLFQSVFFNGGGKADVNLPDTASIGAVWDVSKDFSLAAEAARTGWSRFKELRVRFASGAPDSVTDEKWNDTWFFSLGGTWKLDSAWTLRAGLAYDQTPIPDAYRTPRIPDGNRTWVSVGVGYAVSKSTAVDFGYTHIFAKDSSLGLTSGTDPNGNNFFRGNLTGSYQIGANLVGLQLRYAF